MSHEPKQQSKNNVKQQTLMQAWSKGPSSVNPPTFRQPLPVPKNYVRQGDVVHLDCDDEDEEAMLNRVVQEADKQMRLQQEPEFEFICSSTDPVPGPSSSTVNAVSVADDNDVVEIEQGFDYDAGATWIYPANTERRDYQYSISRSALFKNVLVQLPTGLGKTLIAAVVMYNFYRWYPSGKVVFMAPTRPLVAQQVRACYEVMGIPIEDTIEMTGAIVSPKERKKRWHDKRVVFCTPQIFQNDLINGVAPADAVKCVVVDEAHKAHGNHAYCQVVRELVRRKVRFRVLALSATPGTKVNEIQEVLSNLLIARIERRSETSPDVARYCHGRQIEKIIVSVSDDIRLLADAFLKVIVDYLTKLQRARALQYQSDPAHLSFGHVHILRQKWRQERVQQPGLSRSLCGQIEGWFTLLQNCCRAYELLSVHGVKAFYNFLIARREGSGAKLFWDLENNPSLADVKDYIERNLSGMVNLNGSTQSAADESGLNFTIAEMFGGSASSSSAVRAPRPSLITSSQAVAAPLASYSHPKLQKLQNVLLEHFRKAEHDRVSSRAMIFAEYRDSVSEITELLQHHRPLIKASKFVGQASGSSKRTRGFSQKEQLQVISGFQTGKFNTLVCTCIGEEGLDVGEVDLIVCYDTTKSSVRTTQRMGRTGRKREGRIVALVTQGREDQIFNQNLRVKAAGDKAVDVCGKHLVLCKNSPRMIPHGVTPDVRHVMMEKRASFNYATISGRKRSGVLLPDGTMQNAPRPCPKGAFLSDAELQYWERHFKLTSDDNRLVKKLPRLDVMLSLPSAQETPNTDERTSASTVDLAEYAAWQTSVQKAFKFGAASATSADVFVQLMKLTAYWAVREPDCDDFDAEMCEFAIDSADEAPTVSDSVAGATIRRFCVPNLPVDWSKKPSATGVAAVKVAAVTESQLDDDRSSCQMVVDVPTFRDADFCTCAPRDEAGRLALLRKAVERSEATRAVSTNPLINVRRLIRILDGIEEERDMDDDRMLAQRTVAPSEDAGDNCYPDDGDVIFASTSSPIPPQLPAKFARIEVVPETQAEKHAISRPLEDDDDLMLNISDVAEEEEEEQPASPPLSISLFSDGEESIADGGEDRIGFLTQTQREQQTTHLHARDAVGGDHSRDVTAGSDSSRLNFSFHFDECLVSASRDAMEFNFDLGLADCLSSATAIPGAANEGVDRRPQDAEDAMMNFELCLADCL